MSQTRWTRVDAIFAGALALSESERASYLDAACGDDADLRAEVEELLRAAADSEGLFDGPISADLLRDAGLLADAALPEGSRIGPFRVVRLLGEGGMGAVHLAERADGQFEQKVAIKLVHPGWVRGGRLVERFLRERQILAGLEHPHIARLLDGGVTDEGLPYLVMEYVHGGRIDEYCRERGAGLRERIELLCQVGRAVQHAHRSLVIHRDLKPSNILITPDGVPKLLDFGVATLSGEGTPSAADAPGDPDPTRTTGSLMTPAYAAPEQLAGDPVTTATDVYALGVLLHELLTGERPPRPLDSELVQRALPGDLAAICLKALHDEPEQRYESAQGFVDDLERFLATRPVRAMPDALGYRTRRFLKRNRAGVLAAALVVLSLVGGLGAAVWQGRTARAEALKAREVSEFVLGLFEEADPDRATGDETTVAELLDRGADRIEHELAGQPGLQAEMYSLVGPIYSRMGLHGRGRDMLERALVMHRARGGERSPEVAAVTLELGRLEVRDGEYERAEGLFRIAAELYEELHGPRSAELARVEQDRAALAYRRGSYALADSLYRTARETLVAAGAPPAEIVLLDLGHLGVIHTLADSDRVERIYDRILANREHLEGERSTTLAAGMLRLGQEAIYGGDVERAEPLVRGALELRRQVHGEMHASVGSAMMELSTVEWDRGLEEQALETRRRAVDILRESLGPDHPDYAMWLGSLGAMLAWSGQNMEADSLLAETERVQLAHFGPDHLHVAATRRNRARVQVRLGRPAEAIPMFEGAIESWIQSMGDQGSFLTEARRDLALAHLHAGRAQVTAGALDRAETHLLAAHEGLQRLAADADPPDDPTGTDPTGTDPDLLVVRQALADLYRSWNRPDDAERFAGVPR